MLLSIHVAPGGEVIETATRQLAEARVASGAIVAVVGAIDRCCISTMASEDATTDIMTSYAQPFELAGTGEVIDGRPHIHCTLAGAGHAALAGH